MSINQNDQKVAVVTGGSSGIGKATVREFLKLGYTVYSCARRVELMKDLEGEGARVVNLDVTSSDSIQAFVKQVTKESGRIDVLVNNAGYGSYGTVEDVPISEARGQFDVNIFGLVELSQGFMPMMRKQRSGRIINISSIGGKVWFPLGAWYHATKHALEGLSDCWRCEMKPFGVDVILIEPGAIKTDWLKISMENLQKVSTTSAYKPMVEAASKMYLETEAKGAHVDVIAKTIVKAATSANPRGRYAAPFMGNLLIFQRWILPDFIYDWIMRLAFKVPKRMD